jgi:hypothetical protein
MSVIVVSYARADQPQVRRLVRLLRAAFPHVERAVFWDEDLTPGERWFDQFASEIDLGQSLFVIWCWHASESAQMYREYSYALAAKTRVVPVLIDGTRLPDELSEIHAVDIRGLFNHTKRRRDDAGAAATAEIVPEDAPTQRFETGRVIGKGGFGVVYESRKSDARLHRPLGALTRNRGERMIVERFVPFLRA